MAYNFGPRLAYSPISYWFSSFISIATSLNHGGVNGEQVACTDGVNMHVCVVWPNIIHRYHAASPKFEEASRGTLQVPLSNKNRCFGLGLSSVFV